MPENEETAREYARRVNKVIDHISANLEKNLTLEDLAEVACFSKFHFHRIFAAHVGETVADFKRRLLMEKAAKILAHERRLQITEVAARLGFSSVQNFSKAFRKHFGVTPAETRRRAADFSNPGNIMSKNGKDERRTCAYNGLSQKCLLRNNNQERTREMNVEVKELPRMRVAYARNIGKYSPQSIGPLFARIMRWAHARNLFSPSTKVLGLSWDNPETTPEDKCRYDACVTVGPEVQADGDIGVRDLQKGLFAVFHCEVENDNFAKYWNMLYRDWLPSSGYAPDDRPEYEVFYNDAHTHPEKKWIMDICLPVKPL